MDIEVAMNPSVLAEAYFEIEPTNTQHKLMNEILFGDSKRIIITAMTRYGKSMIISMTILLYAILNEKKRIVLVSPTYKQARILMEWIAGFVVTSPQIANELDTTAHGIERLKKEVTKERITFRNGSEIRILSAEGSGERLMGFGADMIVEDESALISDEVYRSRILRMLGDRPETSVLIQIGNPFPGNHFEENWKNQSDWKHYHIDWKTALEEGRTTEAFIEEQRTQLTPDEFTVLYEANFPEESEDALFKWLWIKFATDNPFTEYVPDKKYLGVDVAEAGLDWTVATKVIETAEKNYIVTDIKHWHKADTMATVGQIIEYNRDFNADKIKVDAIGVGKGVYDRLVELKQPAQPIKVGMSATREPERFLNQKSQFYWNLRTLFEEGRITIPNHSQLIKELRSMRYELTSAGKIKIIDPEDKSPDYADSLMLSCAEGVRGAIIY